MKIATIDIGAKEVLLLLLSLLLYLILLLINFIIITIIFYRHHHHHCRLQTLRNRKVINFETAFLARKKSLEITLNHETDFG